MLFYSDFCPFEIRSISESDTDGGDTDSGDDLDVCNDPDYKFEVETNKNSSQVYPRKKIKEIVAYYKSGKKRKTLKQIQTRYRKVRSIETVKQWSRQIDKGKQM